MLHLKFVKVYFCERDSFLSVISHPVPSNIKSPLLLKAKDFLYSSLEGFLTNH